MKVVKNILITSFDMEVGGVERSLINMLENFDYDNYKVDLMLYKHSGDFMKFLKGRFNLLKEIPEYASFRKSIVQLLKEGYFKLAYARLKAKRNAGKYDEKFNPQEESCVQMQRMWQYSLKYLPSLEKEYDVAISYLWPHYFIADKVKANKKIAWIHTDYSKIHTDTEEDLSMWHKFDYIIAVSEECKNAFLKKYPTLYKKARVMENIVSPEFIRTMAEEPIEKQFKEDKSFKLMTVARLSTAKGIDNAVKALKILHDRGNTDIRWYVVGYGGDEEMIRNLIKESKLENDFILLGKKVNPYPYMKACDIYVQPSRYEGRAVTVTEAQILGKAVVITNYTTASSQLKNGLDGYICELSIEGITDGIEIIYKNIHKKKDLEEGCRNSNYGNMEEMSKIYKLM
ncbi:MAG: glycosyltransferase [Clostridium sp.]|uniref:glycosyltransferase n=1 Tax=Clostridium sp. TaxID=1506 RepID=UPI00304BE741